MIYILTGEIRSGKTTALLDWSLQKNNVDGLLCPDGKDGKRYFLKIKSQKQFKLETELDIKDVISIGNFTFLQSAFKIAKDYLISIASNTENQFLIIDEIGKLELKNEGLHHAAKKIIPKYEFHKSEHLILVVRDYLLEDVLIKYGISQYMTLKKEGLGLLK